VLTYYLRLIGQFYQDMRRQKLRTFLTVLGITWGTVAVVLLLSFGQGLKKQALKSMHGLGTNIVVFGGNKTTKAYRGMGTGRWIGLREEDGLLLKASIPEMEYLSPEVNRDVTMCYKRERRLVNCSGVYPGYEVIRNIVPDNGSRFINQLDLASKRRVVFIGNELRDKLFGKGSDAVGKIVTINSIPFTVIGIMMDKTQNSAYMGRDKDGAFIPFSTSKEIFGFRNVNRFICRAEKPIHTPLMRIEIYRILGRKHKFDPEDEEALWMWDTTEGEQFMYYFFLGFQIFLALGGSLTLLVGGIGVANIMYVVVRERRRELGIKAALGATPHMILLQFMMETFLIVTLGGITGFILSYGVVGVFSSPMLENLQKYIGIPEINPLVAASAVGVLGLVGFAAGWAPARRAANMEPVQALEF